MNEPAAWDTLIAGMLTGDESAFEMFYDCYAAKLHAIADNQIDTVLKGRFDAEDVVQSALRTFFRQSQAGRFFVSDGKRFWSLICAIVLTKAREKARYHTREKRSPRRESQTASLSPRFEAVDLEFSPQETVALADSFEQFLSSLDEQERRLIDLKLQDQTNAEIARSLRSSERTVTRLAGNLERRLTRLLKPN